MAKATITTTNGTVVVIEGEPEEIQKIIALYDGRKEESPAKKSVSKNEEIKSSDDEEVNLTILVNTYKSSDEAELIEKNILDRSAVVDRILLPLYVTHTYLGNNVSLTSGEISKFLSQLSINIFQSNVARALSNSASKYVLGDKARKKGQPVRYRLSRRGIQYMNSVIKGGSDE